MRESWNGALCATASTRSSVRAGLFRKDEFAYEQETDTVICPGGQHLSPYSSSILRGLKKINYVNKQACRHLPAPLAMYEQQLSVALPLENAAVLDRMQARLARRPQFLGQRQEALEPRPSSILSRCSVFLSRRVSRAAPDRTSLSATQACILGPQSGGGISVIEARRSHTVCKSFGSFDLGQVATGLLPQQFDDAGCLRHHSSHDVTGRPDIVHQSYTLPCEQFH